MQLLEFDPAFTPPSSLRWLLGVRSSGQKMLARGVAGLVAGNGILNLLSLMGGPLSTGEPDWLRGLFPLDFAGLARSLTLLSGFALILAALHLWAEKRRAWQVSIALASASVLFHLTKSWDLEEAVCSAAMVTLLWFARGQFSLGASRLQLAAAALRRHGGNSPDRRDTNSDPQRAKVRCYGQDRVSEFP